MKINVRYRYLDKHIYLTVSITKHTLAGTKQVRSTIHGGRARKLVQWFVDYISVWRIYLTLKQSGNQHQHETDVKINHTEMQNS